MVIWLHLLNQKSELRNLDSQIMRSWNRFLLKGLTFIEILRMVYWKSYSKCEE